MSIWVIFKLLGSLALLMFGMKSMSEALQKMAGPALRHALGAMTTNRFTGLLTGTIVTASVQSSTATTVIHLGDYGCQYRHDADGLDYGPRYVDRYQ